MTGSRPNQRYASLKVVGSFRANRFYLGSGGLGPQVRNRITSLLVYVSNYSFNVPAAAAVIAGRSNAAAGQGGFYWDHLVSQGYRFRVVSSAGVFVNSPVFFASSVPQVGYLWCMLGIYDSPGVQLWTESGQAGATVAGAGGTTAGLQQVSIGARGTGANPDIGAVGVFYTCENFVHPDPVGYLRSVREALEQGRDLPLMRAGVVNSDFLWDTRAFSYTPVAPATWVDRISGVSLAKQGRPEIQARNARFDV